MKNLSEFNSKIEFVLTDIDDTLTTEGQLTSEAYEAIWKLHDAGFKIVPITGRPAGWCEMIARFWPVAGVVGENGGFYFRYAANKGETIKKMQRWFFANEIEMQKNKSKLKLIEQDVLKKVPGTALASDQFCRLMDLAIDFCEDVPALAQPQIDEIVQIFKNHGAEAKVSSIHVNGWFGEYDKLTTTFKFLKNEFNLEPNQVLEKCIFVGDSPNDEPMFKIFKHSFGVANVLHFKERIKNMPQYVSPSVGGAGFKEITERLLSLKD